MNNTIKEDALQIMRAAFDAVLPDAAVRRALSGRQFDHPVTLFAIGKALMTVFPFVRSIYWKLELKKLKRFLRKIRK